MRIHGEGGPTSSSEYSGSLNLRFYSKCVRELVCVRGSLNDFRFSYGLANFALCVSHVLSALRYYFVLLLLLLILFCCDSQTCRGGTEWLTEACWSHPGKGFPPSFPHFVHKAPSMETSRGNAVKSNTLLVLSAPESFNDICQRGKL